MTSGNLYRPPTHEEAVAVLLSYRDRPGESFWLSYRRRCLEHWRMLYGEQGDEFVEKVKAAVKAKWQK